MKAETQKNKKPKLLSGVNAVSFELTEQFLVKLAAAPVGLALTDAQREEIDRRIAEMDANPDSGIPWETVRASLRESMVVIARQIVVYG